MAFLPARGKARMKTTPLYSRSTRPRSGARAAVTDTSGAASADPRVAQSASNRGANATGPSPGPAPAVTPPDASTPPRAAWRRFVTRFQRPLLVVAGALFAFALVATHALLRPGNSHEITQEDIDAAVMHTLENNVLPSAATRALDAVAGSVVRVRGIGLEKDKDGKTVQGVGSGVVIVDKGVILTNLHVVTGAEKIQVVFFDGTESDAVVIGTQPEDDLAVLQAKTIPDDLHAATLRSTADLSPGDEVIAVGFPFGIGPSVSQGIVSGMKREYRSPEGKRVLTNLIQFDAAANPGNSGGPLVTMDGAVVGIVTGILNPTEQRVFIGIGFAVPIENAAAAAGMSPF
jgi:S1-C subfamily serine protease